MIELNLTDKELSFLTHATTVTAKEIIPPTDIRDGKFLLNILDVWDSKPRGATSDQMRLLAVVRRKVKEAIAAVRLCSSCSEPIQGRGKTTEKGDLICNECDNYYAIGGPGENEV